MKLLAFESTAKVASVSLFDDDKPLATSTLNTGLTHSEALLPMAEDLLRQAKLSFSDIALYAVTTGPGSFTGVRIGVATVKGLAFGKNLPCVSVSTLEALAENLRGLSGIFVPVMDARRSQVYTALFSSDGETITRITPDEALSLSELAERLGAYTDTPIYLVGDGYTVAKRALDALLVTTENTPMLLRDQNAASVASVAYRAYLRGEYVSDLALAPTYLRLPQADRERLEREQQKENKDNGKA